MSGRRQPQDPEGTKARAFRRWLRRNPEHRWRALRRRLENDDETIDVLGLTAISLLVIAIVGLGLWRLFTGKWFF